MPRPKRPATDAVRILRDGVFYAEGIRADTGAIVSPAPAVAAVLIERGFAAPVEA